MILDDFRWFWMMLDDFIEMILDVFQWFQLICIKGHRNQSMRRCGINWLRHWTGNDLTKQGAIDRDKTTHRDIQTHKKAMWLGNLTNNEGLLWDAVGIWHANFKHINKNNRAIRNDRGQVDQVWHIDLRLVTLVRSNLAFHKSKMFKVPLP